MITKTQLAKMKARLRAATPGPWRVGVKSKNEMEVEIDAPKGDKRLGMATWEGFVSVWGCFDEPKGFDVGLANAEFLASANADMATLIEEVERLRGWSEESERSQK